MQTQTPPGPTPLPLIGNIFALSGGDVLARHLELVEMYGDIVHLKLGPLRAFILANPEHVYHVLVKNQKNYDKGIGYDGLRLFLGQGLVTSERELWRQQRRLIQPKFTPKATLNFTEMMGEVTRKMLERWQETADLNGILHVDEEMFRLTMSVISRAMFSIDLDEELSEVGEAIRGAFGFIPTRGMNGLNVPLAVPLPSHRSFKRDLRIIDDFIDERVAIAKRTGAQDDLLGILLNAQDEETGLKMNSQQLRDELVTLFFAGFETTARSLTWGWYLLSRHAEAMSRLTSEADAIIRDRLPTISDLYQLKYTRMVVDETLRLYPPTVLLARQNVEPDEIGGYPIPAGSLVTLIPYLIHRHPTVWEDVERFDPERFSEERVADRPKYAYIPFASGPRICIGNNFALLEMTIAFAMTVARYQLTSISDETIDGRFSGTLTPTQPLSLRVSNR